MLFSIYSLSIIYDMHQKFEPSSQTSKSIRVSSTDCELNWSIGNKFIEKSWNSKDKKYQKNRSKPKNEAEGSNPFPEAKAKFHRAYASVDYYSASPNLWIWITLLF